MALFATLGIVHDSHVARSTFLNALSSRSTLMDLLGSQDLNGVFRAANLAVAGLSVLCGLSQLFSGIQSFIIGLYIIAFGAVIGLLEFRVPSQAYTYGSFLFSFIGRGVFYILIGASINHSSIFRLLSSILVMLAGIGFSVLETIPSISPPENMNPEGISVGIEDEDIV